MTIEEKAKHYDEAIKRAKHYQKVNGSAVIPAIFPELKESEDEKIRNKLIENFKWFCGDFPKTSKWGKDDDLLVKDIISWLEKQGEPNPYSGVSFEYNGHIWGMCARDGGVEIGCDKQLIAYVNLPQEKDEFDNLSKVIDNKLINCNTGDFIMSTAPNHGI